MAGKTRRKIDERSSRTLPSSPTHSSSSKSDFEFLISLPSPNKLSTSSCPAADELFFKGQILPLHISPRLSMLQSLGPSSSYSSSNTTSSSRHSTSSSNDLFLLSNESSCNSSIRPSSVTEKLELLPHHDLNQKFTKYYQQGLSFDQKRQIKKPIKYFSLSRFSNVFRKDQSTKNRDTPVIQEQGMMSNSNSVKKMKDMVSKYMKKVKPFYEKLSSSSHKQQSSSSSSTIKLSQSFSENILYPRNNNNKCIVSSCPSSMKSSPSRSLIKPSSSSSIEEVQNAIQGAIAHCKKSYSKSSDF